MSKQVKSALATYGRAFLAIFVATLSTSGIDVFNLTSDDVKKFAAALLAACLPVIMRALNPNDSAYGVGASSVAADS